MKNLFFSHGKFAPAAQIRRFQERRGTNMFADRAKIQQVVFNLITNSIKYTPNGGEVKLFASKKDDKIELKIQDNGIGIEKKFQKTIFNKFMQIGNQQNSNGLGLTIVKEIIKLHKGKITLKSTPGIGTEFTISI